MRFDSSQDVEAAYDWAGQRVKSPTDFTGGTKLAWDEANALRPGEGQKSPKNLNLSIPTCLLQRVSPLQ